MDFRARAVPVALFSAALLVAACNDSRPGARDAAADMGPGGSDAAADVRPDTGLDAAVETGVDVAADTGVDVAADTGVDVAADTGQDVAMDVAADVPAACGTIATTATLTSHLKITGGQRVRRVRQRDQGRDDEQLGRGRDN